jgi:hypothetical protein
MVIDDYPDGSTHLSFLKPCTSQHWNVVHQQNGDGIWGALPPTIGAALLFERCKKVQVRWAEQRKGIETRHHLK